MLWFVRAVNAKGVVSLNYPACIVRADSAEEAEREVVIDSDEWEPKAFPIEFEGNVATLPF